MRTVVPTETGVLELNYLWLPTWIGMNGVLKREIEKELKDLVVGRVLNEKTLDDVNEMVIGFLERKYPHVTGIRDYLDGLKFVSVG